MAAAAVSERHLILGGCGFIGREVGQLLAAGGSAVTLADRRPPAGPLEPGVDHVAFELRSADWARLLDGVDVVHHYAWTTIPATANADPAGDLSANVLPTLGLLEAMRGRGERAPRLVFSSSGGTVYGKLRRVPVDEDHPLQPITAYGASKAAVELYLSQYRAMYGLDCRVARLANPFGAAQDFARGQGAASGFLHHALRGQPIEIWGDGEVTRDYLHVSDAAAGLVALARHAGSEPATFNIGSGVGTSLNEIVAALEGKLGRRLEVRRGTGRSFDVPISVLDISRAREVLRWSPRLSFLDGISQTIAELLVKAPDRTRDESLARHPL